MPTRERLWSRIMEVPTGCWEWLGTRGNKGHSVLSVNSKTESPHRIIYSLLVGPIPSGLHLDHLCRNTSCVNPTHLEAVTPKINVLRGDGLTAKQARQTHCLRNHPLEGENLYVTPDGRRQCRECAKLRQKRYNHVGPTIVG